VRIHVTYTGGTIGMVDSPRGLVPGADPENRLDAALKEAGRSIGGISLTVLSPLIDSSDATPESWQRIIDDLRAGASEADAFVVLHGTDTMTHTCAALSYALTDLGRPVVVTGSQLPLGAVGSDGDSRPSLLADFQARSVVAHSAEVAGTRTLTPCRRSPPRGPPRARAAVRSRRHRPSRCSSSSCSCPEWGGS